VVVLFGMVVLFGVVVVFLVVFLMVSFSCWFKFSFF
jgi:hypothetical protein